MTLADDGSVRARQDGAVLRVTLDRPSQANSLSYKMIDTLSSVLSDAANDDALRAIHLSGQGSDFCLGADWASTTDTAKPNSRDVYAAHRMVELVHANRLPVVCSARGYAVGLGCSLALAADFTVAAGDAVFWQPVVAWNLAADYGSTWLLPRLVGTARAKQMLLLGDKVQAQEAAKWGLIHRCVDESELEDTSEDLLARLAAGPTVAMRLAKQLIAYGQHATLSQVMAIELGDLEITHRADFEGH